MAGTWAAAGADGGMVCRAAIVLSALGLAALVLHKPQRQWSLHDVLRQGARLNSRSRSPQWTRPASRLQDVRTAASPALWQSLAYFSGYRLALVLLLVLLALSLPSSMERGFFSHPGFVPLCMAHMVFVLASLVLVRQRWPDFSLLLSSQVFFDVSFVVLLLLWSGGVKSGVGLLLIPELAGASLISRGRMTLFYAAMASVGVLLAQGYVGWLDGRSSFEFVTAGILSLGFFATAGLAYHLARLAREHELVARQRGVDLANLAQVNQLVIQDMQDAVLVVDAKGCIRQRNLQADALLGPPQRDDDVLLLRDYLPELENALLSWRAGGDAVWGTPLRAGTGRSLRPRFVPVQTDRYAGAVIFLEDVDRLQDEAQRLKLAALGRLTANIAHEIRNPLTAISHAAELLGEDAQTPLQTKLARIVRDNALRLNAIVEDVLQLNRRDRAQPEAIPLCEFIQLFIEEFTVAESLPEQAIRLEYEPSLAALRGWFDRGHLHQILWNLVRNAWRFGSQAPGSVRVRLLREQGGVVLWVQDNGPGVAETHVGHLFEPFFTTDTQGNGLGLYIAREISQANRAELTYLGRVHHRTTFRIWMQDADGPLVD